MENPPRHKHIDWVRRTVRIELFILLLGCALLLAAVSLYLGFSSPGNQEYKDYVDSSKYQAVLFNAGSGSNSGTLLYFGHITKISDKYYVLENIYVPKVSSASNSQGSSIQFSKLSCQQPLAPFDLVLINRNQVVYWENLQNSGKVVQAIKKYQQQNPTCTSSSSSTSSSTQSITSTQNTTSTNSTSTNTTH